MSCSLVLRSADEEHFISLISPVSSGTEIPGPCSTGILAEGTSGYYTRFLFVRFNPEIKTNTSTIKSNYE